MDRSNYYMPSSCLQFMCVTIIPTKHVTINKRTTVGQYPQVANVLGWEGPRPLYPCMLRSSSTMPFSTSDPLYSTCPTIDLWPESMWHLSCPIAILLLTIPRSLPFRSIITATLQNIRSKWILAMGAPRDKQRSDWLIHAQPDVRMTGRFSWALHTPADHLYAALMGAYKCL